MAGTDFQTYIDLAEPSVNQLADVEILHSEYDYDQYKDFENNPWTKLTVFAPDVTEYPGVNPNMTAQEYIDMNIRKNTEFLLERGSSSLVICIGESWTFGETVRTTIENKDVFCHAMHSTLGARLAHHTNSDLHQHAIPGNSTGLIFQATEKLLNYHRNKAGTPHEKIYVVLHLTDLNRDLHTGNSEYLDDQTPTKKFLREFGEDKVTVENFYATWERYYLNYLEQLAIDYQDIGAEFVVYKNLTPWYGPREDRSSRSFHAIDNFWLNWLANHNGLEVPCCYFLNAGQLDKNSMVWNYAHRNQDWIGRELDNIDGYHKVIKESGGQYHCSHPFQLGHKLWAEYICETAGWL